MTDRQNDFLRWKFLLFCGVTAVYLSLFMEWLFFVTKSSFMDNFSWLEKINVFLVSGGLAILPVLLGLLLLVALNKLVAPLKRLDLPAYIAAGFIGLIFTVLLLLLIDNFTYTLFKFGVVTTGGLWRAIYLVAFLFLYFMISRKIWVISRRPVPERFLLVISMLLLLASAVSILIKVDFNPDSSDGDPFTSETTPNILLIGSDGLNADSMSLYGYARETTPFLDETKARLFYAENAFTNSPHTRFSTLSILTGVYPETNEILTGEAAYRHLPGILHQLGYYNVQIGVLNEVDAFEANMLDGFDVVNENVIGESAAMRTSQKAGLDEGAYFLNQVLERIFDRLLHILFIRPMKNAYEVVAVPNEIVTLDDQGKIDLAMELLARHEQPVFIHIHLLGTHGPLFYPHQRTFSTTEEQAESWMTDFYDDAVLDFDGLLMDVHQSLSRMNELDNTMIVIYSDHNMMYRTDQRIPIVFLFPGSQPSGSVSNSAQNIDIAPTILDYLGIQEPAWMDGVSLLASEPPQDRLIRTGSDSDEARLVTCNHWFRFEKASGKWFTGNVENHTKPCPGLVETVADLPQAVSIFLQEQGITPQVNPESLETYDNYVAVLTRADIAPMLLRARYGDAFIPSPAVGLFQDVPVSDPNASWIEKAYQDGIIEACADSPLLYCPAQDVTRDFLAIYLLKTSQGPGYLPPPALGIFDDVPVESPFAPWIEDLYNRGITAGCSKTPFQFCPQDKVIGDHFIILLRRAIPYP